MAPRLVGLDRRGVWQVRSGPKLMFSTAPFFRQSLRDGLRRVAAAGFDAVEVMVTQDPTTQEPHLLNQVAEEFGLRIEAIHAPFLLITRRVFGTDPVTKIYRSVHLAEETGAPLVVVHPPYRWQLRYRRWIERQFEHLCRERDWVGARG